MAKDYFQDILPPSDEPGRAAPEHDEPTPIPVRSAEEPVHPEEMGEPTPSKSIRNIAVPTRTRQRPAPEMREPLPPQPTAMGKMRSRWWLWGAAGLSVIILATIVLVAFRATTVTVTPRSHTLTFDTTTTFTAYPAASAATGTLSYTVQSADFEDSEVVSSSGSVHVEEKASGLITVYNNLQTSSFKLVKNTRFESSDGHIFRTPSEVVIPGKKGSTPGEVTITVFADEAGEAYNVAAGKFTVPGLKSSATQYANIYAVSKDAMSGGFVGDKPGVSEADKQAAIDAMRARLKEKALAAVQEGADTVVFPDLVRITYQESASTPEAGGKVRLHERAHAEIPVLSASAFASTVSADVAGAPVSIVPQGTLTATDATPEVSLGSGPMQFTLQGSAQIVWTVDVEALQKALAGKEQSAFQAIVTQFPGVEEAHARIEPFWKGSFPTTPTDIKVTIDEPKA